MSEESQNLAEVVRDAVMAWCARDGGFPIAFVVAVDHIDAEGRGALAVAEMDDQPTHRSLGLSTYLDAWYRDDAQMAFSEIMGGREDDD